MLINVPTATNSHYSNYGQEISDVAIKLTDLLYKEYISTTSCKKQTGAEMLSWLIIDDNFCSLFAINLGQFAEICYLLWHYF